MQCRGPLSDEECRQDRWEISLGQEEDGEEEDGKHDTEASGGHWIAIDIGSTSSMVGLLVDWGVDYAHAYDVEVSHDSLSWTPVWSEAHGPADRNDVASMHTVHFIDLRKAGPGPGEVVRRNGVSARYVRLLIRRAEATVSLWRVLVFGFRDDARMLPHKSIHHLQLYLTDKGGNELGAPALALEAAPDAAPAPPAPPPESPLAQVPMVLQEVGDGFLPLARRCPTRGA